MAIELITGYAGSGHVSAADVGSFQAGICGRERYVLNTPVAFRATVVSSNLVRIGSGDAVDQGRHIRIPYGSYEDVTIPSAGQMTHRVDVIALKYEKNSSTGVETASVVRIPGTTENIMPTINYGDILAGELEDYVPLYKVHVYSNSSFSTRVEAMFEELPSLARMTDLIYPVGAVYISTMSGNPGAFLGGTWVEISGKFLLGQSDGHAAGTTGGAESVTLTTSNMPAHTHTGPAHTHTGPAHTHTVAAHTHAATCQDAGSHHHAIYRQKSAATGTAKYAAQKDSSEGTHNTHNAGVHHHTVTIGSAGGGNTGSSGTGATGSSGTGATGSAGGGAAFSIMPPYLAVYIWKRTA